MASSEPVYCVGRFRTAQTLSSGLPGDYDYDYCYYYYDYAHGYMHMHAHAHLSPCRRLPRLFAPVQG